MNHKYTIKNKAIDLDLLKNLGNGFYLVQDIETGRVYKLHENKIQMRY